MNSKYLFLINGIEGKELKGKFLIRPLWNALSLIDAPNKFFSRGWIYNFTFLEYSTRRYFEAESRWIEADEAEPAYEDPPIILWNALLHNSATALENFVLVSVWFYTSVTHGKVHYGPK